MKLYKKIVEFFMSWAQTVAEVKAELAKHKINNCY
jgi:hypothetical protein